MKNGRGQVVVEAALVLPMVLLAGLGIVQLAVVQQERLLVQYAAFAAARAGVVSGASNARMQDAALLALLPVLGRAETWEAVAASWPEVRGRDLAMHALLRNARAPGLPPLVEAVGLAGLVRVDVLEPTASAAISGAWNVLEGPSWEELDFDVPDTYPEAPGLAAAYERFRRPLGDEEDQDALRDATRLTVRVRFLSELKVPLASWTLFTLWMASHAAGLGEGELGVLDQLARQEGRYFLPLSATYALRMQSSVQRRWLMREEGRAPR